MSGSLPIPSLEDNDFSSAMATDHSQKSEKQDINPTTLLTFNKAPTPICYLIEKGSSMHAVLSPPDKEGASLCFQQALEVSTCNQTGPILSKRAVSCKLSYLMG
ncbi:uncharacterized protein DS421_4g124660 [Arachis hypogaea]|nr:uncharacterized protein DS421_4g124660 [Arachis hypogaea]